MYVQSILEPSLRWCLSSVFGLAALAAPALAQDAQEPAPHAGMLRNPDVSATHIVFVYANDLWVAQRTGGTALPLAAPRGRESMPRFSPDGQHIAFVGNYEGNQDVYTIPLNGGAAHRVTHHPGRETLWEWTPDGEQLIFSSAMEGGPRGIARLYHVAHQGGLPQVFDVPYGAHGSLHADGKRLLYSPYTRDTRTWKRYRGGMATDLWIVDLEAKSSKRITDWEGTDSFPMWNGDDVYYLSDQGPEHRLNLWTYDVASGERRQVTKHADYDVKWPSMGPGPEGRGEIIYQHGSDLMLLDLATETSNRVEITIPGDRRDVRSRAVDASQYIASWDISPTGKRAVCEARGDIWTLPAQKGSARALTSAEATAERSPAWSPDGRWVAYFSDESGEYELYVTQSDGRGETVQLTEGGNAFRTQTGWSPDSKYVTFVDKTGAAYLVEVETKKQRKIVQDGTGRFGGLSWSHDSRYIAYARTQDDVPMRAIWIYDVEKDSHQRVTSGMFDDEPPTFDRHGDYLYFASTRSFAPTYSDIDTTFVYRDGEILIALPLRKDMTSPFAPESDEESWDDDKSEKGEGEENAEEGKGQDDGKGDEEKSKKPAAKDALSGSWEGTVNGPSPPLPSDSMPITMDLVLAKDGTVTGTVSADDNALPITDGRFDSATGKFTFTLQDPDGITWKGEVTIADGTMNGTAEAAAGGQSITLQISATRSGGSGSSATAKASKSKRPKKRDKVTIDFEDIERRAMRLPVPGGSFGRLAVNDKGELLYARTRGNNAGIKIFDLYDEKNRKERDVAKGARNFILSADGKKMLIARGASATIQNASAGGSGKPVPTKGMTKRVAPRTEWRQMLVDAWRLQRDYFYVSNLHGVDWKAIRTQYEAMLADCASREDLDYIIGEMIAELNVGHAYVRSSRDNERAQTVSVGMLGADFEVHEGAYRIQNIVEGGAFDVDARGPLSAPGVDVQAGDYLLAVNGIPLSTDVDPWAAFQGLAGQVVALTVSAKPQRDDEAREVLVTPTSSENSLRYRSWVERKRKYVEERTDGQVGYIYVPNTGVQGQNELFRQFYGQSGKRALIIDERWNGGGQIPTRFVELLNRPVTNYWAVRDGRDWTWPPDSHQGPKCMLINGRAGSGGDAFPAYFKQMGLGKLIGTRTWGGLVGISGNPALVDGGSVTVPTFGYYEKDGTWGIEGHGVDPDIEVLDDPALMFGGGDPQLDRAIQHMLQELQRNPYRAPQRPTPPNRAGMGVTEIDR